MEKYLSHKNVFLWKNMQETTVYKTKETVKHIKKGILFVIVSIHTATTVDIVFCISCINYITANSTVCQCVLFLRTPCIKIYLL